MPTKTPVATVILAAGQGTRMKSPRPKVAFELCGWPMVRHVVAAARSVRPTRNVVVVGHGREEVERLLAAEKAIDFVVQRKRLGTGHAVKTALKALDGFDGIVLVLCGDVPLLRPETLKELLKQHRRRKVAVSVLSVVLADGGRYGRIVRDADGAFCSIVEARDASAEELAIAEVNTGIIAFDSGVLRDALRRVRRNNDQGEYYLTDVPAIARSRGEKVQAVACGTSDELLGVNTFVELADAQSRMRARVLEELMIAGVQVVDPATTFVDRGVRIGPGTRILPCTMIEQGVVIGAGCEVGPFSHVRPGTVMKDGAEVGNFVETKKTVIGERTKAKHLSYLGDAVIGADTNIGCGTITANYDGTHKHVTKVGDGVHIGSGTVLIAPVRVGNDATTGAGAIVTAGNDVAEGDVVVGIPARSIRSGRSRR
jgi:bifunctional UDP-N-acetylglucosamine pyrophosphorylase / glucosamine-1-phosphate N-acetyltransferase